MLSWRWIDPDRSRSEWAWVKPRDEKMLLVQRVARMRGINGLQSDYLRYVISSREFTDHVLSITTGINVPHISGRDIRAFTFDLPTPDYQRRVVSILSAYDDLIEITTRRIAILEEMAQCLFDEWFVRLRYPGSTVANPTEPISQKENMIWPEVTVASVAIVSRGHSYRGSELVDEGGIPFINLKCIARDGGFRSDGIKRYSGDYKAIHVVRTGDIVTAVTDMTQERRIVGQSGRVPTLDSDHGVISMDLVKICPNHAPERNWLYAWLRWSPFARNIREHANGVNVLHLAVEQIKNYRFQRPPQDLTIRYSDIIDPILKLTERLNDQILVLSKARDFLLPRLCSGEIDVASAAREVKRASDRAAAE